MYLRFFPSFLPQFLQPSTNEEEANKLDGVRKERINGIR